MDLPIGTTRGRPGLLRRLTWRWQWRWQNSDRPALLVLLAFTVALTVLAVGRSDLVPFSALLMPLFLASLWLGPRLLPWFVVLTIVAMLVILTVKPDANGVKNLIRVVIVIVIGLLVLLTSFRRSRLGVSGPRSESMFVDLRDRITRQGEMPRFPSGWVVESVTQSAGGTSFAGDFVVASHDDEQHTADMVVVDVSGKGVDAGTRSLLLAGAFGGLISAVRPEEFLVRANEYLLRQDWEEGFATAIHLHLDVITGAFEIRKAGHPPAVWLRAGSGTWSVLDSEGPVLGLMPEATFESVSGTIAAGDALLLYTDGLVETTDRDIGSGIDKLAGKGQRLFQTGFAGGARWIVDQLSGSDDDRALLLVHRSG
ncbi:MAG TPA: PP2C family protein-serine/threonine phosphatase [Marmoricola sp.]|nr:PP2C family protein-serine/threonine phosphatase [Marmoricola sp.]